MGNLSVVSWFVLLYLSWLKVTHLCLTNGKSSLSWLLFLLSLVLFICWQCRKLFCIYGPITSVSVVGFPKQENWWVPFLSRVFTTQRGSKATSPALAEPDSYCRLSGSPSLLFAHQILTLLCFTGNLSSYLWALPSSVLRLITAEAFQYNLSSFTLYMQDFMISQVSAW